ncbi:MAG TPA: RNA polymerase sigma factor [Spirochaetia bacterium]|nr:RNA polymerase sigma factor [Spirochaetia bacterium]
MEQEETDLVREITGGNVDAFRTIVERHQARIFYLGLKFLRRFEDAEDFAQEVFLRAFEKLSAFKGDGPFAAWLYRIAFNLGISKYRINKRIFAEEWVDETPSDEGIDSTGGESGQGVPSAGAPVERLVVAKESEEEVRRAVDQLPARYAVIVRMHFFDGLTYQEISEVLDIPVNTIKSHVFRAKHEIRKRLADYMET